MIRDEDLYDYNYDFDFEELNIANKFLGKQKNKEKVSKDELIKIKEKERVAKILEILRLKPQNFNDERKNELFTLLSFSYDDTIKDPQNVILENGKTILHFMYELNLYDFAEEVKQLNINKNIVDDFGKVATDYCKCNDLKSFLEN